MGRHEHDHDDRRTKETKEDRLLRKARDYVEREERHERKKSNKSHRRKRSDDDDSEDRRSKHEHKDDRKKRSRRDNDEEEDRRRHKKHKKKKSNHSSRSDKKSKKVKIDKSKLHPLGNIVGKPPSTPLDVDKDYFAYHQHLSVYLYREEGIAFGDLTSEESHQAFQRFCRHYNEGSLEVAYYEDVLPLKAVEESKTTTHKWSFQTSATEVKSLHMIEEGVRKQTEYDAPSRLPETSAPTRGNLQDDNDVNVGRHTMTPKERLQGHMANKRLREHVRTAEEELSGGRKEGRERQLEKKKETGASLHGSARDREDRMGGVELGDEDLYGGGSSDFAAALARDRKYKEKRASVKESRLEELQKKEHDRQEAMLKALGLTGIKPGQKITIAPRKDAS